MDNIIGYEDNAEIRAMKISLNEAKKEFPNRVGLVNDFGTGDSTFADIVEDWFKKWFGDV